MPKVVGEFDAAALNSRMDTIAATNGGARVPLTQLCAPNQSLLDVVDINYRWFFRAGAYESVTSVGQIATIQKVDDLCNPTDGTNRWHPDDYVNARFQVLPNVLTGASRYPTEFLVGRVAVTWQQFRSSDFFELFFWERDEAQQIVAEAIEKGDAYSHRFEPGEVVKAPPGSLHRRNIPQHATGFRFFMRKFPAINIVHAGTNLGRMRPY